MTLAKEDSIHRWSDLRALAAQRKAANDAPNTEAEDTLNTAAPPSPSPPTPTPIGAQEILEEISGTDGLWLFDSTVNLSLLQLPDYGLPHIGFTNHSLIADNGVEPNLMGLLETALEKEKSKHSTDYSPSKGVDPDFDGGLDILIDAFSVKPPGTHSSFSGGNASQNPVTDSKPMDHDLASMQAPFTSFAPPQRNSTPLPNITIESQITPSRPLHSSTPLLYRTPSLQGDRGISTSSFPTNAQILKRTTSRPSHHQQASSAYVPFQTLFQNPYALEQQTIQLSGDASGAYDNIMRYNSSQQPFVSQVKPDQNPSQPYIQQPLPMYPIQDKTLLKKPPLSSESSISSASTLFTQSIPSNMNFNNRGYLLENDQVYGDLPSEGQFVGSTQGNHTNPPASPTRSVGSWTNESPSTKASMSKMTKKKPQLSQSSSSLQPNGIGQVSSANVVTGERLLLAQKQIKEIMASRKAKKVNPNLTMEDYQPLPQIGKDFNSGTAEQQLLQHQERLKQDRLHRNQKGQSVKPSMPPVKNGPSLVSARQHPQPLEASQSAGSSNNQLPMPVQPGATYGSFHIPPSSQVPSSQGFAALPTSQSSVVSSTVQVDSFKAGQFYNPRIPVKSSNDGHPTQVALSVMIQEQFMPMKQYPNSLSSSHLERYTEAPHDTKLVDAFERLLNNDGKEVDKIITTFQYHLNELSTQDYTESDFPTTTSVDLTSDDPFKSLQQPDLLITFETLRNLVGMSKDAVAEDTSDNGLKGLTMRPTVLTGNHTPSHVPGLEPSTEPSPTPETLKTPPSDLTSRIKLVRFEPEAEKLLVKPTEEKRPEVPTLSEQEFLNQFPEIPQDPAFRLMGTSTSSGVKKHWDHLPEINGHVSGGDMGTPTYSGPMVIDGDGEGTPDFMRQYSALWDSILKDNDEELGKGEEEMDGLRDIEPEYRPRGDDDGDDENGHVIEIDDDEESTDAAELDYDESASSSLDSKNSDPDYK